MRGSIFPVLICYVYVAKIAGPRWMKNREPFKLRGAILTYNFATVAANAYFCIQYLRHSYLQGGYSLFCQGIDYESSFDEHTTAIVNLHSWYSWVRIADFLDTFFFLARKKNSQVTCLHVLHHFLVVMNMWIFTNFGSDGQTLLGLCVNSFVHVIMYSYYFLAALGPSMQKYLWWKRYLTELQIVQFVGLMLHMAITLFHDCGYPRALAILSLAQGISRAWTFHQLLREDVPRSGERKSGVKCLAKTKVQSLPFKKSVVASTFKREHYSHYNKENHSLN
ncbi:hypothetical protein MRX96_046267 [Rhipicephalus microplus]